MFGEKLRWLREERQLTQKEVAEAIGVEHNTYSGYERGSHLPSLPVLASIIHVLRVDANYFFENE